MAGSEMMQIAPITGTFGARVENIDIANLSVEAVAEVKQALSTYKLLVIDGQDHITPPQLRDFAANWGQG